MERRLRTVTLPPEPVCAYCRRKPVDPAWRPFCGERCKLADLGRWLSGEYRVPGPPAPDAPESSDDNENGQNATWPTR